MEIYIIQQSSEHFISKLVPVFVGAVCAYLLNYVLHKMKKKEEMKAKLCGFMEDLKTLTAKCINIDALSSERKTELENLKEQLRNVHGKELKSLYYGQLLRRFQVYAIELHSRVDDLVFIAKYDSDIYQLILVISRITKELNGAINDLNKHIEKLMTVTRHDTIKTDENILSEYTDNVLAHFCWFLYISEMLRPLLGNLIENKFYDRKYSSKFPFVKYEHAKIAWCLKEEVGRYFPHYRPQHIQETGYEGMEGKVKKILEKNKS